MAKFRKETIAKDIEKYMREKKLIKPTWTVVIPEGGYSIEHEEWQEIWNGGFEVFKNSNDIEGYGSFTALVPEGISDDDEYSLTITYKGKEHDIFECDSSEC